MLSSLRNLSPHHVKNPVSKSTVPEICLPLPHPILSPYASGVLLAEPAQTVREARKQGSSGRLVSETEVPSVRKERRSIWQKIRSIFFPVQTDEELLIDDRSTEAGQEALTEWAAFDTVACAFDILAHSVKAS